MQDLERTLQASRGICGCYLPTARNTLAAKAEAAARSSFAAAALPSADGRGEVGIQRLAQCCQSLSGWLDGLLGAFDLRSHADHAIFELTLVSAIFQSKSLT